MIPPLSALATRSQTRMTRIRQSQTLPFAKPSAKSSRASDGLGTRQLVYFGTRSSSGQGHPQTRPSRGRGDRGGTHPVSIGTMTNRCDVQFSSTCSIASGAPVVDSLAVFQVTKIPFDSPKAAYTADLTLQYGDSSVSTGEIVVLDAGDEYTETQHFFFDLFDHLYRSKDI